MNQKEIIQKSKFLSLILRHKPEEIDLELDNNGWANVNELLLKCQQNGINLDFEKLKIILEINNKKRFTFNDDFTKIRANQGHSIDIEMDYKEIEPPEYLYHGTSTKNSHSILEFGIKKMQRQYVHLSLDIETALNVGQRHGKPIVFSVNTKQMFIDGFKFYLSKNNVWLTNFVPNKYIKISE